MPRPRTTRRQGGFSLLETVACVAIVGVAIVCGYSLLGMQAEADTVRDQLESARQILSRDVERIRGLDYHALPGAALDWQTVADDARFERAIDVGNAENNVRHVVVSVRWTNLMGRTQKETVRTARAKDVP